MYTQQPSGKVRTDRRKEYLAGKSRPAEALLAELRAEEKKERGRSSASKGMTSGFIVHTTPHFDRLAKSLRKQHPEFTDQYDKATTILRKDPYNQTREHHIKKLENVPEGSGQYRLRLGRWRFRYDIESDMGLLYRCGLRREDTY